MLQTRIFEFNPLGTNCVVLWNDGSHACAVADPGMSSPEGLQTLCSFLEAHALRPEAILLTHGHFDHVWGVDRLLGVFPGIPVYLHPQDNDIMDKLTASGQVLESFSFLKHDFTTVPIADGDVLRIAGITFKVIHTPGHTPGGVCYYAQEDALLLSGDTLFAGSIGRTDLAGGDYDVLMDSIRGKLLPLPGDTDVIPGHGQPTSIAREGMSNPFLEPFNEPLESDE